MQTENDRLYSMLSCCNSDGVGLNRLVLCMYLYQVAGFDCGYVYKVTASGVRSQDVSRYADSLVDAGLLRYESHLLAVTSDGRCKVGGLGMFPGKRLAGYLGGFPDDLLEYLVLVGIALNEFERRDGYEWVYRNRDQVCGILVGLKPGVTPELLNRTMGMYNCLRGGHF